MKARRATKAVKQRKASLKLSRLSGLVGRTGRPSIAFVFEFLSSFSQILKISLERVIPS